jgi:biopolymer transport protein ExbD
MILWSVRHAGSPESVDGLTADDVLDAVKEDIWDPSDEVMGPDDPDWVRLDQHPVFAQAMADYEPPPPKHREDETKLDMNPLIDVALVLLIFFMLTTTYQELRKEFEPPAPERNPHGHTITSDELKRATVRVTARMENGQPVYRVENEVVAEGDLEAKFKEYKDAEHDKLAVEYDPDVPWQSVIAIQDAAAGAKFQEIIRLHRAGPRE